MLPGSHFTASDLKEVEKNQDGIRKNITGMKEIPE